MTQIKPFKAAIYNPEKIKDLSRVVCPPYDIISPSRQTYYHERDPYNFIQILLGKDIPGEDKYRRAAALLRDWLKDGLFVRDETPAVYFYRQQYELRREKRVRVGFISLMRLENDKKSSIYAHENTHREPKEDRLKLLRQVKANLSPIFVVFQDKRRIISRLLKDSESKRAFIDVIDDEKTRHQLWRIDDAAFLSKITAAMQDEDIFIADGHHRYEVACRYRDELSEKLAHVTGDEDFNYVMTYFTSTDPLSLLILPIHRLVTLKPHINLDALRPNFMKYFHLEEIRDKVRFFFLMEKCGLTEHVLGVYHDKRYWLLRLKNVKILDKMMCDKPKAYRTLDVSIFNSIVLQEILGFSQQEMDTVTFSPQVDELIEQVDAQRSQAAFFLNPVKIQQIVSVALTGTRMPPKSTYFYPKVLSGLVINTFDEELR